MMSGVVDAQCPFCGEEDDYFLDTSQTTQQYSHSSTIRRFEECDACGYQSESTTYGNARRTSTQPWRPGPLREKMPDEYCLIVCPICEDALDAVKIGDDVEVSPDNGYCKDCGGAIEIAYTFADVPNHNAIEEPNRTRIGLRQIWPHLRDAGNVKGGQRTRFESPTGLSIRVGECWVSIEGSDSDETFTTAYPDVVEEKLRRPSNDWEVLAVDDDDSNSDGAE